MATDKDWRWGFNIFKIYDWLYTGWFRSPRDLSISLQRVYLVYGCYEPAAYNCRILSPSNQCIRRIQPTILTYAPKYICYTITKIKFRRRITLLSFWYTLNKTNVASSQTHIYVAWLVAYCTEQYFVLIVLTFQMNKAKW